MTKKEAIAYNAAYDWLRQFHADIPVWNTIPAADVLTLFYEARNGYRVESIEPEQITLEGGC